MTSKMVSFDPSEATTKELYRVRVGDTLTKIAAHLYGDPSCWKVLYDANVHSLAARGLAPGRFLHVPRGFAAAELLSKDVRI